MAFRGGRPPQHYGGNFRGSGQKYQDDSSPSEGYRGGRGGGGYQERGSYTPRGGRGRQAPGPPDPPDHYDSPDTKGSPYKRAPGPPDPPRRNQFGEPIESGGGAPEAAQGGGGRGFRPYQHRGRGSYHSDQQEGAGRGGSYHDDKDGGSGGGSSYDRGRGSSYDRGRGSSYDRGRGSGYDRGRGSSYDRGRGSSYDSGRGSSYDRGRGRGSYDRGRGGYQSWQGDNSSSGGSTYNKDESYNRGGRGYYRGGGGYRGRGDYQQDGSDGRGRGGYFRGRGDFRGRGSGGDRGNQFGRGRGFTPRGGAGAFEGGGWGEPVRRSVSQPDQASPNPSIKRGRSASLSEDSDENIPKAYRLRRRSPSSSPLARSPSPKPKPKKVSVVRRSFTPSPSPEPQRFPVGPRPGEAPTEGDAKRDFFPPPSDYVAKQPYEGYTGRGSFRGRTRPPMWRGRGRGYYSNWGDKGEGEGGSQGDVGEGDRGGFRGRARGWVSRGRGWFDQGGRGGFRGRWFRGSGWVDRGRGTWVDRGRGFRGRGWVDRGRGGWVDRGRGRFFSRGRGNWVDRGGRGGFDRGRGGWVDRGRGRGGGWDSGGSSAGGPGGPGGGGGPGFSGGANEEKKDSDFNMGPGWVWDDKNSCWKRKWVNKDQDPNNPQMENWKEKPVDTPAVNATGDVDYRQYQESHQDSDYRDNRGGDTRGDGKNWNDERSGDSGGGGGGSYGNWEGEERRDGGEREGGEWEEDGWVWDDKEQAWRSQREDGTWEWEWEVEGQPQQGDEEEEEGEYGEQGEQQGDWVWDEDQQAWKRPRDDGSWEWEWEYQEEEGEEPERQPEEQGAEPRRVGGDWGQPVNQRSSSLDRRNQEWMPEDKPQRTAEFREYEYDQTDDFEREMNAKHDKAKKALAKYQKATRQSEALANKIEKHRRRLEEIESKLNKYRSKKKKGYEQEDQPYLADRDTGDTGALDTSREQQQVFEEAQFSPESDSDSAGPGDGGEGRSRKKKKHKHEKGGTKRKRSDSESLSPLAHKRQKSAVTQFQDMNEGNMLDEDENGPSSHPSWIRCNPADPFFQRDRQTHNMISSNKMIELEDRFEHEIVLRSAYSRDAKPKYEKPVFPPVAPVKEDSDSEYSSSDEVEDELRMWMEKEMDRKKLHPERLHPELWFNEPGESNTGTMCRCSAKARQFGIRHNIYQGDKSYPLCETDSNNLSRLYHYRINVSPVTNFLIRTPTVIDYDSHEYIFEGFSLFSHYKIGENVPVCKVVRFNIEYTLHWIEEDPPEMFDIRSLDQFCDFLFEEILELYDMNLRDDNLGCRKYHLMPRFARSLPDNGKEILSMDQVHTYLLKSAKPLVKESDLSALVDYPLHDWNNFVDTVRGSIATYPGMRPSSIRIDQLDKFNLTKENLEFPKIVHFGMRPSQVSYVGNPNYNKQWKQYVKFRHLLAYKPRVSTEDKEKLKNKEEQLQNLRLKGTMKREVTAESSCEGFIKTGINADVCQHALMIPVLISHLRFHKSLDHLEEKIRYSFKDRSLLQYAMTHPSYRYGTVNYGTNPDHARNSMFNCGIRQPQFGNRQDWIRVHRKRGIHVLIRIMAKMAKKEESVSLIDNYERLEFLGDSVVEFITTTHLYFMFPGVEEGVLATFRSAIVQNQHLTELARHLNLQDYFLYSHGVDLCHESELRRAMANCFEALMGALFVDGGIALADRIFSEAFFTEEPSLLDIWTKLPIHPLQEDEPHGDRHWIEKSPILQSLLEFEEMTGIKFNHIRLLARAFTLRNVGYTALTLGHNQRLEFLGDTVLQLVVSEYVFKFFPEHHEGHLSLLRQCLVNNKTQAIVCENLGMERFMISTSQRKKQDMINIKTKEKADLIEAYMASLYVDKGLEWVRVFTQVCFFPRLQEFIVLGDWNDPKSRLQQCCLLLRDPNDQEPEMPKYKVVQARGPTNTRVYKVAVYFKGKRLSDAEGQSIQQAQMNAAKSAMEKKEKLFPFLSYHKSYLETKFKEVNDDLLKKIMKQEGAVVSTRKKRKRFDRQKKLAFQGAAGESAAGGSIFADTQVAGVKTEKVDEVGEKITDGAPATKSKSKRKRKKGAKKQANLENEANT